MLEPNGKRWDNKECYPSDSSRTDRQSGEDAALNRRDDLLEQQLPSREGQSPRRVVGFDVARGLAYLGMVFVNFKVVMAMQDHSTPAAKAIALLEGRAAATFVILAGVGLSLMSSRARESGDLGERARIRRTIVSRALFLFVVGLFYFPLWPADILHFYGLYLAIGVLFLFASDRWTLSGAIALVVAFVPMILAWDYEREWNWDTLSYDGLWTPAGMIRHLFFNGFHPVVPWAAFLLFGLWLGRRDLTDSDRRRRLTIIGASTWSAAELVSRLSIQALSIGVSDHEEVVLGALLGTEIIPPMPLYILAAGGASTVLITLAVGISERSRNATWTRALAATGQLALTLYVAHVVIGMGTLSAVGWLENRSAAFAATSALVFNSASIAFSVLWLKFFTRGPLELVMRRLAG